MKIENKNRGILLVDDDAICNIICKKLIEELGFKNPVEIATNGRSALHYLELAVNEKSKPLPGLILLDINMPVMNGWEFLETLEELSENLLPDIKVVMVTSSISPFDIKKAKNTKMISEFITKPVNLKTMAEVLERYI
ncbi:response regulator [Gaetbulibacter sp. M240]|uniref:response regulator n=1 Tax=Gaetbulibacter sp. M240 TaxID=3126511 RepID=UPI00374EF557